MVLPPRPSTQMPISNSNHTLTNLAETPKLLATTTLKNTLEKKNL